MLRHFAITVMQSNRRWTKQIAHGGRRSREMQVTDVNCDGLAIKRHASFTSSTSNHSHTPCQTSPAPRPTLRVSNRPIRAARSSKIKNEKHESQREAQERVVTIEAADPCSSMIHIRIRKTCPSIVQYGKKKVSTTFHSFANKHTRESNDKCTKCLIQ